MRIGICVNIPADVDGDDGTRAVRLAAEQGYDYIEMTLSPMMDMDAERISYIKGVLAGSGLKCECLNVFFPASMKLTGPARNEAQVRAYIDRALARAHEIGADLIVFGSGGARNVPEGFQQEKAYEQLAQTMQYVSGVAEQYGIRIAIEALNKGECNILLNMNDADKLMCAVDKPNIKILLDYYHFMLESDSEDTLRRLAEDGKIIHSHFAVPEGRVYPNAAKPEYKAFYTMLRGAGYNDRCSIEAKLNNPDDPAPEMSAALSAMRQIMS